MEDYVKRMLDEEKELRLRCLKFENFISDKDKVDSLSMEEQKLMWQQFAFMEAYYKILYQRLKLLNVSLLK